MGEKVDIENFLNLAKVQVQLVLSHPSDCDSWFFVATLVHVAT